MVRLGLAANVDISSLPRPPVESVARVQPRASALRGARWFEQALFDQIRFSNLADNEAGVANSRQHPFRHLLNRKLQPLNRKLHLCSGSLRSKK
jgi:hypothetical protein